VAKRTTETTVEIKGMKQLLRACSKIDKDLQNDIRDASAEIASDLVSGAQSAASTPLQNLAASGLKVKRDRVPVVRVGRTTVRPGTRLTDIFYGAEFGGGRRPTTQQFLPHRGRQGYFLYPVARSRGRAYSDMWADAIDQAFATWDYRAPK